MRIFPDDCPDGEDSALVADLRRMLAEAVGERDTVQTDAHDELSALRATLAEKDAEIDRLRAERNAFQTLAADQLSREEWSDLWKAVNAALGAKP